LHGRDLRVVSRTLCSTLYPSDERREKNPTAGGEKLRGGVRLQVGHQADVNDFLGEVALAAAQVPHVALVDLFGLDRDGLVFVGLQRVTPQMQGLDVTIPQRK